CEPLPTVTSEGWKGTISRSARSQAPTNVAQPKRATSQRMGLSLVRSRRIANREAGAISVALLSWYYRAVLTLGELVEQNGPLRVRAAIGWTLRTALALWTLHADDRVHGRIHAGAVRVDGADCAGEGVLLRSRHLADDVGFFSLDRADGAPPSMRDDVWA